MRRGLVIQTNNSRREDGASCFIDTASEKVCAGKQTRLVKPPINFIICDFLVISFEGSISYHDCACMPYLLGIKAVHGLHRLSKPWRDVLHELPAADPVSFRPFSHQFEQ